MIVLRREDFRRVELCNIRGEYVYVVTPTAKTAAQRQATFRARKAAANLVEVRGIFLPVALHPAIKEHARNLLKKAAAAPAS